MLVILVSSRITEKLSSSIHNESNYKEGNVFIDKKKTSKIDSDNNCEIVSFISAGDCPLCTETLLSQMKLLVQKDSNWNKRITVYVIKKDEDVSEFISYLKSRFRVSFQIKKIISNSAIISELSKLKTPLLFKTEDEYIQKIIQITPGNLNNVYNFFENINLDS